MSYGRRPGRILAASQASWHPGRAEQSVSLLQATGVHLLVFLLPLAAPFSTAVAGCRRSDVCTVSTHPQPHPHPQWGLQMARRAVASLPLRFLWVYILALLLLPPSSQLLHLYGHVATLSIRREGQPLPQAASAAASVVAEVAVSQWLDTIFIQMQMCSSSVARCLVSQIDLCFALISKLNPPSSVWQIRGCWFTPLAKKSEYARHVRLLLLL